MRDSDAGRRQELAIENAALKATNLELEQQVAHWKASYYPLKEDFEGLRKNVAGLVTDGVLSDLKLKAEVEKLEKVLDKILKVAVLYYPDYTPLRKQFDEIISIARQARKE